MLSIGRNVKNKNTIVITDKLTGREIEIKVTQVFTSEADGQGVKLGFKCHNDFEIMRGELTQEEKNRILKR